MNIKNAIEAGLAYEANGEIIIKDHDKYHFQGASVIEQKIPTFVAEKYDYQVVEKEQPSPSLSLKGRGVDSISLTSPK